MADVITRLKVDSTEYDSKIKRAVDGLKAYTASCRQAGGTLEYVDKEAMDFLKSLGQMQTVSNTTKGQLRELTNSVADLRVMYSQLTQEEKSGAFGSALQESIGQLTQRAGVLRDEMDDLNEEIKHIASDTQFSDGMRMMTSTIGSCASAVVAWSGDGKQMEEVIKDLAKIQTTVAAVEALTKAFQKQNLVLLKNPYVAVAAAIAAVGVAIYEVVKHTSELDHVTKALNDVQAKGRENAAQEVMRISALNDILHDNTRSLDERKDALDAIQNMVPEYHGALDTEGNLINDNTTALDDYITNLQRAATAQAAFDRMVELQKQKLDRQVELKKAEAKLRYAKNYASATTTQQFAGAGAISVVAAEGISDASSVSVAQSEVDDLNKELAGIEREIRALQELADANTIAGNAAEKRTTKTTTGNKFTTRTEREVLDIIQQRAKRIADVEAAMELLRNTIATTEDANLKAWSTQELEKYQEQLDALNGVIKEVPAEVEKIPTAMEKAMEALKGAKSAYLVGSGERSMYVDANTAANLQGIIDKNALEGINIPIGVEVTDEEWQTLVEKINEQLAMLDMPPITLDVETGNVSGVTQEIVEGADNARGAWSAAASAVGSVGSALSGLEDPGAKVAGIVAAAIAQVAAGLGSMLAQPQSTSQSWGWIALAASGAATMVGTIASIKSATSGYANGGLVLPNGSPYQGDNIVARLNAGEGVLTQQGIANAAALADGSGFGNLHLEAVCNAEEFRVMLKKNDMRRGRRNTYR